MIVHCDHAKLQGHTGIDDKGKQIPSPPCKAPATHYFTWPGQERAALCEEHLRQLCKGADAAQLSIEPLAKDAPAFDAPIHTDVVTEPVREKAAGVR